jgi:hypothetical protein
MYLLLGPRPVEGTFGNDLGSGNALRIETGNFVALGEASLAEQLGLGVLLDHDFSVCFSYLLLDYLLLQVHLFLACLLLVHSKNIRIKDVKYNALATPQCSHPQPPPLLAGRDAWFMLIGKWGLNLECADYWANRSFSDAISVLLSCRVRLRKEELRNEEYKCWALKGSFQ